MWTTRWYARDPKLVVDEIQHWHETYQANNFPFHDLTAILKKDYDSDEWRKKPIKERIKIRRATDKAREKKMLDAFAPLTVIDAATGTGIGFPFMSGPRSMSRSVPLSSN